MAHHQQWCGLAKDDYQYFQPKYREILPTSVINMYWQHMRGTTENIMSPVKE